MKVFVAISVAPTGEKVYLNPQHPAGAARFLAGCRSE